MLVIEYWKIENSATENIINESKSFKHACWRKNPCRKLQGQKQRHMLVTKNNKFGRDIGQGRKSLGIS